MKIVEQSAVMMGEIDVDFIMKRLEAVARTSYQSKNPDEDINITNKFITKIVKMKHLGILEHINISFDVVANRAILNEWVRHRIGASYVQTSTRYLKYGDDIKVIRPHNIKPGSMQDAIWIKSVEHAEEAYHMLLANKVKAQNARDVLPLGLASEMAVTMNLRAWRNFFELRAVKEAHPQIRSIAKQILRLLAEKLPIVFGDLLHKKLVIFEGADATGKSYLAEDFRKKKRKYKLFRTPHLLRDVVKKEKDINNMTRQVMFAASHYDMLQEYSKLDYIVQDRCFLSSMVYYTIQEGIKPEEYSTHKGLQMVIGVHMPLVLDILRMFNEIDINIVWRDTPVGRYYSEEDKDVFTVDIPTWQSIRDIYLAMCNMVFTADILNEYPNTKVNIMGKENNFKEE